MSGFRRVQGMATVIARRLTIWIREFLERFRERRRSMRLDSEGGCEIGDDGAESYESASSVKDDDVFTGNKEVRENYYNVVLDQRLPLEESGSEETLQSKNATYTKSFRYCPLPTSGTLPNRDDFLDDENEGGSSHDYLKHSHDRVPESDEETVCTEADLLDEEIEEPTDGASGQFRRGSFSLSLSQIQVSKSYAGVIRTRFPPEPNGPLHLGHAKAIHMNFSVACKYGGECILRFDDTNPYTASQEYCNDALEMVRWLGYWPAAISYTSNYFDKLILSACQLIVKGDAYVCHQPHLLDRNQDKEMPPSPWRNRTTEENMIEFKKMCIGVYKEGEAVLRLKVRTRSGLRDPVAYRICNIAHYRTGKHWCIYPTYDFSHPLIDSWEGIAVSLCSSEFVSHRSLYQWVHKKLGALMVPQREFKRLEIRDCMLSKRQLRAMKGKSFQAYDDPRLATLAGLRRRGIPPQAIRRFVREGYKEFDQLLDITREVLLLQAKHCMVVLQPLLCYVINYEEVAAAEGKPSTSSVRLQLPDCPSGPYSLGHHVTLTRFIYINKFDFDVWESRHLFTPKSPVHLRGTRYTMHFTSMSRGEDGDVLSLSVMLKKMEEGKARSMKVLTWVSEPVPVIINLFDPLDRDGASKDRSGGSLDGRSSLARSRESLDRSRASLDRNGESPYRSISSLDRSKVSLNRSVTSLESSFPAVHSCKALMEAGPFNTLRLHRYFTYGQTLQAERFAYITLDPPPSSSSSSSSCSSSPFCSSSSCSLCRNDPMFNVTCLLRLHPSYHATIMQVFKSQIKPPSHYV